MSDETQKRAGGDSSLDELTFQDVADFLVAKNITETCPSCGYEKAGVATSRGGKTPSIISFDENDISIFGANVNFYFQLVCGNCGYMRMFERTFIDSWKKAKAHRP